MTMDGARTDGGRMEGMDGLQSSGPPPFLNKTYDMVDDSSTDNVVSWGANNNSFVVWLPADFARDLLPKYFKHNNFSSFVRQLNTYGFRKVDPDRWEFANEGFLKGQRHLLKNIHRRKPVSHHQPPPQLQQQPQQQTQTQTPAIGPVVEVGKFGLEGEVERLKRDKNVLMLELVRLRQQQQATEHDLHLMGERFRVTEARQQQMMAFLAKAMQNPAFLAQLVQSSENSKRIAIATDRKRRRLPKTDIEDDPATEFDGQIVKYQREDPLAKLRQYFTPSDISSMMEAGNPFVEAILATPYVDKAEETDLSNRQSGVTLTEMQVPPPEPTSMPMDDSTTALPVRSLLPVDGDAVTQERPRERDVDFIIDDLNSTVSTPDVYASLPGSSSQSEGLAGIEPEAKAESRSNMGTTGANDQFWEQFLTANPESPGGTDSEEAETVSSGDQTGEMDSTSWWNTRAPALEWNSKPSVDRLAEQLGQLAPGIKH